MKITRKTLKLKKKEDDKSLLKKKQKNRKIKNTRNFRLEKIRKIILPDIFYTKIKYKSDIYGIGDNILVRDLNGNYILAKIKEIIKSNGFKKYPFWPTIEVEW